MKRCGYNVNPQEDTMANKENTTLLERVNEACQQAVSGLGYNYRLLDEETVISYCKQVVIQRVKMRVKGKEQRKEMKHLVQALKAKGIDINEILAETETEEEGE